MLSDKPNIIMSNSNQLGIMMHWNNTATAALLFTIETVAIAYSTTVLTAEQELLCTPQFCKALVTKIMHSRHPVILKVTGLTYNHYIKKEDRLVLHDTH